MQNTKHTPGPWHVGNKVPNSLDDLCVFSDKQPYPIALCACAYSGSEQECIGRDIEEANARLVAAAPEMLRELQGIGHQTTITTEHFNRLQRLITKATAPEEAA